MKQISRKTLMLPLLTAIFPLFTSAQSNKPENHSKDRYKLWYDKPAANWNEALPIGNGYIGGMIFGGPEKEQIQLNESTIWGGGPNNNLDSAAKPYINQVRELLNQKKYEEAQAIANKFLGPKGNSGMPYQLAGNLMISFPAAGQPENYRRELDISRAVATVRYKTSRITFKREYFTALNKNVLMVRLTADRQKMISCKIQLQSPLQQSVLVKEDALLLKGKASDHENQKGTICFDVLTRAKVSGGKYEIDSTGINISKADTVIIFLAIGTNFVNYHNVTADPFSRAKTLLDDAFEKKYDQVLDSHVRFYQSYFNRVKFNLVETEAGSMPTDRRIQNFAKDKDNQLAELYFQFGRYLLICSSQPGSQAANLQGVWNGELKGPWDSKYTININTEMNYWPSEVTQLSELSTPLFNLIDDVSQTGRPAAKIMYGARGWMLHHNTDIWRITGIVDGAFWGLWPTSNAWLCQHLWEHYLYTGDVKFLARYYPIMKDAARFFIDVLQKEPEHGWLVVSPSISPEHEYITGPKAVSVAAGTTMDNQLVYGLFTNVIRAAQVLRRDKDFSDTLSLYRSKLPPMQIGKHGQLQEWLGDFDRTDDNHRHISHLYGLFPGNQISPFSQPKLFAAAKNSLIYRGDVSTGWSMAWKINLWARLLDGNHAYKLIRDQIKPVTGGAGGTYPNFFDAHPPFQIDGNFGCTSGMAEMLLQSYDGAIYILPALPDDWQQGNISGLMARGGFKVDITWDGHKVKHLTIYSKLGGNCRLRLNEKLASHILRMAVGKNKNIFYEQPEVTNPLIKATDKDLDPKLRQTWLYDFETKPGKTYKIL